MKSARELLQELVDAHQVPPPSTTTSSGMRDIRLRAAWEAALAYLATPDDRPPREATTAMLMAGSAVPWTRENYGRELSLADLWRAMYDAFPTGVRDDARLTEADRAAIASIWMLHRNELRNLLGFIEHTFIAGKQARKCE